MVLGPPLHIARGDRSSTVQDVASRYIVCLRMEFGPALLVLDRKRSDCGEEAVGGNHCSVETDKLVPWHA